MSYDDAGNTGDREEDRDLIAGVRIARRERGVA